MKNACAHSLSQTLVLHLLPGALATAVFHLTGPPIIQAGCPPILALDLAILVAIIPFELGCLLLVSRRATGSLSLRAADHHRVPIPARQYFILVPLLLVWSAAAFAGMAQFEAPLAKALFWWLPEWSVSAFSPEGITLYSRDALAVTFVIGLMLNGIAGPVVEEFYFRGYLLPRIPTQRTWAPLINVLLFSLYHFFSPWQFFTRVVAGLPMVYAVAWKRNLYLAMLTHAALNTLGWIATFVLLAR